MITEKHKKVRQTGVLTPCLRNVIIARNLMTRKFVESLIIFSMIHNYYQLSVYAIKAGDKLMYECPSSQELTGNLHRKNM